MLRRSTRAGLKIAFQFWTNQGIRDRDGLDVVTAVDELVDRLR